MSEQRIGNGHHVELERVLQDIRVVLKDGQELLRHGLEAVREQARLKADSTGRFVREKPYHTMGIVFGLGVLAGLVAAGMLHGQPEEPREEEV